MLEHRTWAELRQDSAKVELEHLRQVNKALYDQRGVRVDEDVGLWGIQRYKYSVCSGANRMWSHGTLEMSRADKVDRDGLEAPIPRRFAQP